MGEVYVEVKDDLNTFDVETADGFEPEDAGDNILAEDLIAKDKKQVASVKAGNTNYWVALDKTTTYKE